MQTHRRSKIRPPRKSLTASLDFPTAWSSLSMALLQILQQDASSLSFEELYRKAYTLVLKKHGKELYEAIQCEIKGYLEGCYDKLVRLKGTAELLDGVNSLWRDFEVSLKLISDVFMYLDKVYCREQRLPLVYEVGVSLFRDVVVKKDQMVIGRALNEVLLETLERNRNGEIIDFFKIKEVLGMYASLEDSDGETYYTLEFERYYLERSGNYYELLAEECYTQGNGRAYIAWVDQALRDEEDKTILYLSADSIEKLKNLLNKIMIVSRIDKVLKFGNEGLKEWIHSYKEAELRMLYKLLKRAGYFEGLRQQLDEIIKAEEGLSSPSLEGKVKISAVSAIYINQVIKLKEKYDQVLSAFSGDVMIQKTIENSFTHILNNNAGAAGSQPKISEFLSYYIDEFIKKSKVSNDTEIESFLDNAIVIFRFIKDKDIFEKFYKNHLAKRLLKSNADKDDDLERLLIERFRNEIGSTFTAKLEGMFKDINLSREISQKFNHTNFQVSVLTKTYWPIQPSTTPLNLPPVLEDLQSQFTSYYTTQQHTGRNLQWVYNFGSLDIRARFAKKVHELNCSVYCGVIILLFQEFESITYKQLKEVTMMPESELQRSLLSISVAPRTRILTKEPLSRDFKDDDTFHFNFNFTAPMTKVKILTVVTKSESDSTRSSTLKEADSDRKYEVDAMIVRIMKANKVLSHQQLIEEIVKLSKRFKPNPGFIKRRVEGLIEREYLKRDDEDNGVYHYLA